MTIPIEVIKKAEEIADMLFAEGDNTDIGWHGEIDESLIERAREITNKPYCIVKDWYWWDVDIPENIILDDDKLPILVYSHYIIDDELKRFQVGGPVRTSLLCKFHPPAFFETGNTVYILTGKGTRKTVTAENVMTIM